MSNIFSTNHRGTAPPIDRIVVGLLALAGSLGLFAYAASTASKLTRFNDFYREALPAYTRLGEGHLLGFVHDGPAYIGSLVLRAPFALVPTIWGGGIRLLYFASAVPCAIALAAFCTWLSAQPRFRGGITWASRIAPIACLVLNPIVIIALLGGHPEEILGAVLCVAAVVLAVKGRAGWAGLLIGLAVVNKSWAAVAVPVVFVALSTGRLRATCAFGATTIALVPLNLLRAVGVSGGAVGLQTGTIFNPPQLLWWFGSHSFIASHARLLIVLVSIGCAVGWQMRVARSPTKSAGGAYARITPNDALLLLALVLLLRAALDPWNNLYYHAPFLFALIAYEIRSGRMPLLTFVYTFTLLFVVPIAGVPHMSWDLRAAAYAIVVLPTVGWMASRLYAPHGLHRRRLAFSWRPARVYPPVRSDEAALAEAPLSSGHNAPAVIQP